MKNSNKIFFLILIFCCFQLKGYPAQNNFAYNSANNAYNSGLSFLSQGNYTSAQEAFKYALVLQPGFENAKKALVLNYQIVAFKYYNSFDYYKSISEANKALALMPDNIAPYNIIGQCYLRLNDTKKAIDTYEKILSLAPNDTVYMQILAIAYSKNNQYEKSAELYKKLLLITPKNKIYQTNLNYANFYISNITLDKKIKNIGSIEQNAPKSLYKLIKLSKGVPPDSRRKIEVMLCLLWSEPNAQIMLQKLIDNNTPINITIGDKDANAIQGKYCKVSYKDGILNGADINIDATSAVNIPYKYVEDFNNSSLSIKERIYDLHVLGHELGHSFITLSNINENNSMEQEIGVSMIGLNIANKIIMGTYLNKNQVKTFGETCLKAVLSSETHKNLPVFGKFNNNIQHLCIDLPYPEEYSDLPAMYKKLLSEGTVGHNDNLDKYIK